MLNLIRGMKEWRFAGLTSTWTMAALALVLAFVAYTAGSDSPCANAQASCPFDDDSLINGDWVLRSNTAFDVTVGHSATADAVLTIPNTAGAADTFVMVAQAQTLTNKTLTAPDINGGTVDGATLGATDPVTLQGLDLDDLVAGDTLYASAPDTLARLAKGSDGEVLTLASGIPSWAGGGGVSDPHGAAQHTDVTREVFLPASSGHIELGTPNARGNGQAVEGGANVNSPKIYFSMKVPNDFVSFIKVEAAWVSNAASGNMYWLLASSYGASGENYQIFSEYGTVGVTATAGTWIINLQEPADPLVLTDLAVGDVLGLHFDRKGADSLDTLNSDVMFIGLLFTYIANQ